MSCPPPSGAAPSAAETITQSSDVAPSPAPEEAQLNNVEALAELALHRHFNARLLVTSVLQGGHFPGPESDRWRPRNTELNEAARQNPPSVEDIGSGVRQVTSMAGVMQVNVAEAIRRYTSTPDHPAAQVRSLPVVASLDDEVARGLAPRWSPFAAVSHGRSARTIRVLEADLLTRDVFHPELVAVMRERYATREELKADAEQLARFRQQKVAPLVAHVLVQAAYHARHRLGSSLAEVLAATEALHEVTMPSEVDQPSESAAA